MVWQRNTNQRQLSIINCFSVSGGLHCFVRSCGIASVGSKANGTHHSDSISLIVGRISSGTHISFHIDVDVDEAIHSKRRQPEVISLDYIDKDKAIPLKRGKPEGISLDSDDDWSVGEDLPPKRTEGSFPNIGAKSKLPTHIVDEMEGLSRVSLAEYLIRDMRPFDEVIKEIDRLLTSADLPKY
jgi:hypothetical protein